MMKQQEIPAVICFNKKDVGEKKEMEKLYEIYTGCGYCVVLSSTYEGEDNGQVPDSFHQIAAQTDIKYPQQLLVHL